MRSNIRERGTAIFADGVSSMVVVNLRRYQRRRRTFAGS